MTSPPVAAGASRVVRLCLVASVIVAAGPLVYDGLRASWDGWRPVGDEAFVVLRVHDVFTGDTPLLGMPAGAVEGYEHAHHLGPLAFWMLAVPYRLLGRSTDAIVLGVVALNVATVVGIAAVARRLGGSVFATVAMLITTWFLWSFGAQLGHSPFNPAVAVLPIMLLVLLAAAAVSGDTGVLPALAFVGSFVAQAHLSFVGEAALLLLWVVGVVVWRHRRRWDEGDGRVTRGLLVATLAVLVVCWSGPLVEQFTGGRSNLSDVVGSLQGGEGGTVGLSPAADVTGEIMGTPPPVRLPAPTREPVVLPLFGQAEPLRLLPVVAVGIGGIVLLVRRRQRDLALVAATALVAVGGVVLSLSRVPVPPPPFQLGGVVGWYTWMLWPLAAAVWTVVVLVVLRLVPGALRSPLVAAASLALAVPLAFAALPDRWTDVETSVEADLVDQIGDDVARALPADRSYRLVVKAGAHYGTEPGVVAELEDRGYRFLVDTENRVTRELFTLARRYESQEVAGTLYIVPAGTRIGDAASEPARLLHGSGLSEEERQELGRIRTRLRRAFSGSAGLRLTDAGEAAFDVERRLRRARSEADYLDLETRLRDGSLARLYRDGLVTGPSVDERDLQRLERLVTEATLRFEVWFVEG